ncbi:MULTISPECIES: cardiolipin synthase [Metabacillus]|uniref:Cardiolipin synthase n=2 Tax=Metabacillus TaxID=2675233 RepID=A0A179STW5_9BACI|nr:MULTISPECIES: cardiolipin synthase [Metabacillus]OAS84728.1 cardiolipin synthase [Metabacillus litoralis]QNF27162.1 cardiolipin synthase [Metabacillus sp. KUDC1714]
MHIVSILLGIIILLNIVFAVVVIFRERRDASSSWAWLLVLFFIPLLGFLLYLLFGQNLSRYHMFQWEDRKKLGIETLLSKQLEQIRNDTFEFRSETERDNKQLIYMHLINNDAVLTKENHVDVFIDGNKKFDKLLEDIENAKDHIHLQYYILKNDQLGNRLIKALTKKAQQGIKVRVLYDDLGSRGLRSSFFAELRAAEGEVEEFFPSKLRWINLRLNYRNHRKLVIIDGQIGYVGGFNVGDEYLGLDPKFGYWRDTHLRIQGPAVYAIQTRFILDWNQATHKRNISYLQEHFPKPVRKGDSSLQIVTSGPDSEWEQIKNGYIKMISTARKTIRIQTPYFIPDASVLDALKIACLSGVDVNIMIPNKPDHPFVYWATMSYIGEMLSSGARVYIYENGFIHAKTIIVDHEISSVGTANIDVRSFKLNFEVNAFIYDTEIARKLDDFFQNDIALSRELSLEAYHQRPRLIRFKESISRLLSPIL